MLCENLLGEALSELAKDQEIRFFLETEELTPDEVFQPDGLLSLFCREAEKNSIESSDIGLGFSFTPNETFLSGIEVKLNKQASSTIRFAFLTDVVLSYVTEKEGTKVVNIQDLFKEKSNGSIGI